MQSTLKNIISFNATTLKVRLYYYPFFTDTELGLRKLIKFTITKRLRIDFNSDLPGPKYISFHRAVGELLYAQESLLFVGALFLIFGNFAFLKLDYL